MRDFPNLPLASCIGTDPESFFNEDSSMYSATAHRVCMNCPEREPCGEWAVHHDYGYGMWGGLTPIQRREIRKRRGIINDNPSKVIEHLVGYRERSK